MDDQSWRRGASVRDLLAAVMLKQSEASEAKLLDAVALLKPVRDQGLALGQVGTVVELIDEDIALVEFSDDQGRGFAIVPVSCSELLVLKYLPEAA